MWAVRGSSDGVNECVSRSFAVFFWRFDVRSLDGFFFFVPLALFAKVRILTFHYNRPDFLEYQMKAFQKFLLDDYEVIVFNDAPDARNERAIRSFCEKRGIVCVRFEPEWHWSDPLNDELIRKVDTQEKNSYFLFPWKEGRLDRAAVSSQCSIRHSHVIQYALDHYGYDHDDIVVIMDADVFPIKPISIRELLTDVPLAGIEGGFNGHPYLWVPFIAFDPRRLPDVRELRFHVDLIDGVLFDTGSHSFHYLQDHPEVKVRFFPRRFDRDLAPWDAKTFAALGFERPDEMAKIFQPSEKEFYIDYSLVHHVGGSGLHPLRRTEIFLDLLHCMIDQR